MSPIGKDGQVLYYEAHVTAAPNNQEAFRDLAKRHDFHVAKFLMLKDRVSENTQDMFATNRDASFEKLLGETLVFCSAIKKAGMTLYRYKIEAAIVDSRHADVLDLAPSEPR